MDLSHDDVTKILEIIDGAEHLDEVELVFGGFHLHVQRDNGQRGNGAAVPRALASAPMRPASAPAAGVAPAAAPRTEAPLGAGEIAVKAPMLGTFYRAPSPGAPAFVEVGQRVRADDTVCLIEVMKLFNSIRAGVDGVVTRVLADDAKLVEYDQALIVVSTTA
jgi:acetyl-CoA carboxylase biotin carboxyl carrier protein